MSTHDVRQVQGPAMSAGAQAQFGVVMIGAGMTVAMVTVSALLTVSTSRNSGTVDVGVGVTAFLLFTAAAAVGSAFGFLFGLPRARLTDQLATTGSAHPDSRTPSSHYLANSNLIKVSDWLTTIVIGLGLVNLGNAVPALRTLASALQAPLGGAPYAGAIGVSTLIGGCIGGFILVYVYTSTRVRQLLEDSDRQTEVVPHLAGLRLSEAERAMSASGLRLAVEDDADKDQVVALQKPAAGERLPLGSAVAVLLHTARASGMTGLVAVPKQRTRDS